LLLFSAASVIHAKDSNNIAPLILAFVIQIDKLEKEAFKKNCFPVIFFSWLHSNIAFTFAQGTLIF
jgi:hypothetical protein